MYLTPRGTPPGTPRGDIAVNITKTHDVSTKGAQLPQECTGKWDDSHELEEVVVDFDYLDYVNSEDKTLPPPVKEQAYVDTPLGRMPRSALEVKEHDWKLTSEERKELDQARKAAKQEQAAQDHQAGVGAAVAPHDPPLLALVPGTCCGSVFGALAGGIAAASGAPIAVSASVGVGVGVALFAVTAWGAYISSRQDPI